MLVQHIAITQEGVRVDNGTVVTVTIPFEHIDNIAVAPQKICCFCQRNPTFPIVTVHRAAAPLEQMCFKKTKATEIYGLLRPQEFVDAVRAMQDSQAEGTYRGMLQEQDSNDDEARVELPTVALATPSSE